MADARSTFSAAQTRLLAAHGTPARSRLLSLPGPVARVHVLEAGAGAPVVLVHGGNSVAVALEPLLGELAREFHVFAPDRPGCGLTDTLNYRGVNLRQHAVTFLAETLAALRLQRVSLVGNSMGGYFALVFALAYPERVARLVLVGEPAGSAPRLQRYHQLLAKRGLNRLLYATKLRPSPQSLRAGHQKLLVVHPERLPQAYWDVALAAAQLPGAQQSWLTMVEQCCTLAGRSRLTYALRPELSQLHVPTLFVWGERDAFGPPRLAQEMAARMPSAEVAVVPEAGHLVWLDQPAQTAQLVRAFLTRPAAVADAPVNSTAPARIP